MKFSVIIPLEFNRGLAVRCIRAWVEGQSFRRDAYEILVAASETHDPKELKAIGELLLPQDKLVRFPVSHDMGLVASAASLAVGEVLVFTESHCLPEPNFLEMSTVVLNAHAEWGGFSGQSYALTHNRLSVIEAEFYEQGIISNLTHHAWLKVLDQCFVIHRKDYWAAGGIEPAYGHFAEWHFAGRLHLHGIKIGYAPEVQVGHYYVGDMADLKTFTMDFTEGEMRCASAHGDACSRLFEPYPEWKYRSRWNRTLIDSLWCLLRSQKRTRLRNLFKYGAGKVYTLKPAIAGTRAVLGLQHWLLNGLLFVRWNHGAKAVFRRWVMTCARLARLMFLQDFYQNRDMGGSVRSSLPDEWTPADATRWEGVGFYELEYLQETPFRWSAPVGCIRLCLGQGDWRVTLDFLPDVPEKLIASAQVFINGRPCVIRRTDVLAEKGIEMTFNNPRGREVDIAWILKKIHAPRDPRALGLPVTKIRWQAMDLAGGPLGVVSGATQVRDER